MKSHIVTSWHNILTGTMIDHIYIGTFLWDKTANLSVRDSPTCKCKENL